jgi:hypothetical protein
MYVTWHVYLNPTQKTYAPIVPSSANVCLVRLIVTIHTSQFCPFLFTYRPSPLLLNYKTKEEHGLRYLEILISCIVAVLIVVVVTLLAA